MGVDYISIEKTPSLVWRNVGDNICFYIKDQEIAGTLNSTGSQIFNLLIRRLNEGCRFLTIDDIVAELKCCFTKLPKSCTVVLDIKKVLEEFKRSSLLVDKLYFS